MNDMHFEDMAMVNHRFRRMMSPRAQEIRDLRRENERLRLEVYHLELTDLQLCMHRFNFEQNINCNCADCDQTDRILDYYDDEDVQHETCIFRPKWERFLEHIGATIAWVNTEQPWLGDAHGDVDADVYCHVDGNWLRAGWGRKLRSLDEPRGAMWDIIVLECSEDGTYEDGTYEDGANEDGANEDGTYEENENAFASSSASSDEDN
jgi:hypothetical protein